MIVPYLLRSIIVLDLLAITAGPAPALVNLRRAEFSAETMIHGAFPGTVVGMALGGRDAIIPEGVVYTTLVAAALTVASYKPRHSGVVTAVLLTAFFSPGVVVSLRIGDMSGQLESLVFGRLLDIVLLRMGVSTVVLVLAAALLALTWRARAAVAFDREASRTSGILVIQIDITLNAAPGTTVVAVSTTVDVLLVVGCLIVPGVFGRPFAAGPRSVVLPASTCTLVGGWADFGASLLRALRSFSPQACMALGVLVCFTGVCMLRGIRVCRVRPKPAARETTRETSVTGGGEQQRLSISSCTRCST